MSEQRSTVNASELVATFTEYDEPTSPYDGLAMRLTLVADIAFLAVGKLAEQDGKVGVNRFTHDDSTSIGVDAVLLYETLGVMLRRDDRHAYDRLREGTLMPGDPRVVGVGVVAGVRRRA
jgi:hypothetical protein